MPLPAYRGTTVVAGGAGVVGSLVVETLRDRGINTVVWDRSGTPAAEHAVVDLTDPAAVRAAILSLLAQQPAPYSFVMAQGVHEFNTLADLAQSDGGAAVVAGNFTSIVNIVTTAAELNVPPSRFVLLGSIAARTPIAFSAIYSASKAAAEVFLEAAGYELDLLGHSWCIVDVGGINTGFNEVGHAAGIGSAPVHEVFSRVAKRIHSSYGMPPGLVAQRITDVATKPRVRHHYTIGSKARVASGVSRLAGMPGRRLLVSMALLRNVGGGSRRTR